MRLKWLTAVVAVLIGFAASPVKAQATYTFQGGAYTSVANPAPGVCIVGECLTYTTAMAPNMTLTFATPLPTSMPFTDVTAQVVSFTYDDGARTVAGPDANAIARNVFIATDAAGLPTSFTIHLQRTPGPPYLESTPGSPNGRYSFIQMNANSVSSSSNSSCAARAADGQACNAQSVDGQNSSASNALPVTVSMSVISTVPTLSEWAMIGLALSLAAVAMVYLNRRRTTA